MFSILMGDKVKSRRKFIYDRHLGLCSVPLYSFLPEEVESFHSGKNIDDVKKILQSMDILQYFLPAPDHLALGLVEKKNTKLDVLIGNLSKVPEIGHPFGQTEIVTSSLNLVDIVGALQEQGFVVEGENWLRGY